MRVPQFCSAQIRVTKVKFIAPVEPPGRIIVPKNRQDRLNVCRWARLGDLHSGRTPSSVMPHVSRQHICDRPIVLRPIPGDPVESVDATDPNLNVWLTPLELGAELTCRLNKTIGKL